MDDIVENADDSQSVLLPEILSHIFAYLPLTDRKKVRLTCGSWYDNSLRLNVIKSEKYLFRTHCSVEEIAELMMRSKYSQLNLEFQGVRVEVLPADAWKVCGERIQWLEFFECQWNPETIRNVILYCTNLTSIVIKSKVPPLQALCDPIYMLCLSNVLDDLIKKGLRRSKLQTFAMFNGDVQLSESVVNKLFLLFPGIKHFSTGQVSFDVSFVDYPISYPGDDPLKSLRLDHYFNPKTRLESLTINLAVGANSMETLVQKAEQGIRLKKFEAMFIYRKSMRDILFDVFKSQRNLEILKLGIVENNVDENIDKTLFFHILDNCPNLREFVFETNTGCKYLEPSELPRFIASTRKLKFLSANIDVDRHTPAPLYHDSLAKCAKLDLTRLKWETDCMDADFWAVFFQRCPFLLHLDFRWCHDAMLQIIFQFLVKLHTLVLYGTDSCTDFGFTGRGVDGREEGYSIKRLHQLKYLKLEVVWSSRSSLTGESTLELQLPHLEFLSLTESWFTKLRSEEALDHFASYLPALRVLDSGTLHLKSLMTMRVCHRFKNLYRVVCCKNLFQNDNEMAIAKDIFRSCPSLRYICVSCSGVFFYDPFTGTVVLHRQSYSFKFSGHIFYDGLIWY